MDPLLAALHSLTGLRAALLSSLSSGLRNDAPDDAIAMRQKVCTRAVCPSSGLWLWSWYTKGVALWCHGHGSWGGRPGLPPQLLSWTAADCDLWPRLASIMSHDDRFMTLSVAHRWLGASPLPLQWRLSEIGLEDYAFVLLSR